MKAYALTPGFIDEPRVALQALRYRWRRGDTVYATPNATPCLIYYHASLSVPLSSIVQNVFALDGQTHVPTRLSSAVRPGRAWLVLMRTEWKKRAEAVQVREYFDSHGSRMQEWNAEWTSVILYQLTDER